MQKPVFTLALAALLLTGCATAPMSSQGQRAPVEEATTKPSEPEPVYSYKEASSDAVFEQPENKPEQPSDKAPKETWTIVSP